jgi:thymidylate synthase (FAD)
MASYNEISGRYVEFEPEFYYPKHWRVPAESNKQGSKFDLSKEPEWYQEAQNSYEDAIQDAYERYKFLLEHGVAREMARMVLPLSLYSQFYFTVNARSLMNFLSLRAASDAQWEIQQYAMAMHWVFKEKMPMTYLAWENNRYITP